MNDIRTLDMTKLEYNITATSDSVDGGNSESRIEKTDSSIILHYTLKEGAPYPYAGIQLHLGNGKDIGENFSKYDSIFFSIKIPDENASVRVYLRNFNKAYSEVGKPISLKFNEIEYNPSKENYPVGFVPNEMRVASWWVAQHGINAHDAVMEISNVPLIEIQSASNAPLGESKIEVKNLIFKGKLISAEKLYIAILYAWLAVFVMYLGSKLWKMNKHLRENKKRARELEHMNKTLEIQALDYERISKEDPLTGCLNRAGLGSLLSKEVEELRGNDVPLSFILFDIDFFKNINDSFGHAIGDQALINISQLVRSRIRITDSLVRWGGEEFIVVCSETILQNAYLLAENLRNQIEKSTIIPQAQMTSSFGVAEMSANEEINMVFERLDKALYESKQNGRNKVTVAKTPTHTEA